MFKIGDYVTRKKYGNDIVFKIIKIEKGKYILKGVELRLLADSNEKDLVKCDSCKKKLINESIRNLDVNDYFYIPGVVLHLDTDNEYLERCLDYYKNQKVKSFGFCLNIEEYKNKIIDYIEKYKPSIVVITGHDAYYKDKNTYKNSKYFIETVGEIRKKYKKHSDMIIISGACQSDYDGLIKAGSTYASSPKHINVHALDPAIIASYLALSNKNKVIDIKEVLNKTEYGNSGFGGIITFGVMESGYPRKE